MARRPEYLQSRVPDNVEVVPGDLLDTDSLHAAFENIDTAYYLVHSLGSGADFEVREEICARNFQEAAARAGVKRIIYLGGLGDAEESLSPHLRSRQRVGELLRAGEAEVIEFRASIVIGSGSLSFEMIRSLVERLPVMILPRWVTVAAQPIAIEDLLNYLTAALTVPPEHEDRILEIGGADVSSYEELMREYARQRGLRRLMIRVPFLTPRLSSLWLGLITPVFASVGRQLIDSIRHATVVQDDSARDVVELYPVSFSEAISAALQNEDFKFATTRWSDSLSSMEGRRTWSGIRFGSRFLDSRSTLVHTTPEQAFEPVIRIGGKQGWYFASWLWRLRGWLDLLLGGVGMRRGRRDPYRLYPGDTLDCWRVEKVEADSLLRLKSEMILPGRAWLEFEVTPAREGVMLTQTAIFDPSGLWGRLYWWMLYPLHVVMWRGMISSIARAAERKVGT
jgi:uncharacterized protein YbjT (DUF2867 family)